MTLEFGNLMANLWKAMSEEQHNRGKYRNKQILIKNNNKKARTKIFIPNLINLERVGTYKALKTKAITNQSPGRGLTNHRHWTRSDKIATVQPQPQQQTHHHRINLKVREAEA